MKKVVAEHSNINKMKNYNPGAEVKRYHFLITKEGEVNTMDFYTETGIEVTAYEGDGLKGKNKRRNSTCVERKNAGD